MLKRMVSWHGGCLTKLIDVYDIRKFIFPIRERLFEQNNIILYWNTSRNVYMLILIRDQATVSLKLH